MVTSLLLKATAPTNQMSWIEAFVLSSAALLAAIPVVATLYLVKSALGINLMAGASPLHDLLYHFIR